VLLLPVAVVALVTAHVLLVRRHGVVPPFDLEKRGLTGSSVADRAGASQSSGGAPSTGAPS
ncbi:MAG TPA: hypothetical protein VG010_08845, partial [Solirubrobacteraceae bacterium]|nr:hypothetical protein [Solirubrobacteraceae bacterium]